MSNADGKLNKLLALSSRSLRFTVKLLHIGLPASRDYILGTCITPPRAFHAETLDIGTHLSTGPLEFYRRLPLMRVTLMFRGEAFLGLWPPYGLATEATLEVKPLVSGKREFWFITRHTHSAETAIAIYYSYAEKK